MKLSEAVKPISYFKTHASEIIRDVGENRSPVIITLNGEARAVIQGIREYEELQESLALLKILAQSKKSLEAGKYKPVTKAFKDLRKKWATAK
jgi:prevent-host-death family protein